jgi:hypothetical protein
MDPDATLEDIVRHLEDGDRLAAAESMDNLVAWMEKGGFKPEIKFDVLTFLLQSYAEWLRK